MPKPTPAKPSSTISDRSWDEGRNGQSKDREIIETIQLPGPRCTGTGQPVVETLRLSAHLDTSYDFQSRAKAEVWRQNGWTEVHHIPGRAVRSLEAAIEELRRISFAILSR